MVNCSGFVVFLKLGWSSSLFSHPDQLSRDTAAADRFQDALSTGDEGVVVDKDHSLGPGAHRSPIHTGLSGDRLLDPGALVGSKGPGHMDNYVGKLRTHYCFSSFPVDLGKSRGS
jgi:hypothetical protein